MRSMRGEERSTNDPDNHGAAARDAAVGRDQATSELRSGGEVLRVLNDCLHELSQPMTVLLCATEYGATLDSSDEMKEMVRISRKACERLLRTVVAMQDVMREAIETTSSRSGDQRHSEQRHVDQE